MTYSVSEYLGRPRTILGEGPIWHAEQGLLYWIDILRPAIYRHHPATGQTDQWAMPSPVGAIALGLDGCLIVALEHEAICRFYPANGELQIIVDPIEICGPKNIAGRYNDGSVDPMGNFWVGWLTHERKQPGALFRIDRSGAVTKVLDDLIAPNGLGWSPDGHIMYITDSNINTIWAYECDLEAGVLGARRAIARQERALGIYDGLCVDAEGNIWTALYGGAAVLQLFPDGNERARFAVPARLVTSCCFCGAGLRRLLITTAVRDQSAAELEGQPLAGSLFSVMLPVSGLPETTFTHTGDTKI